MAWERGFVKIAQNFPERGTPFVQSYKVKKLCKKRLTIRFTRFIIILVKRQQAPPERTAQTPNTGEP